VESKYPKGLFFLVFTEFWERFGYYLMIGIFFLYMTADGTAGGMGWERSTASDIFGTFIALAYLTPFMGGLLADLKLGYRFSITLGGILMGIGYCMLAIPEKWAFFTSLVVMVIGNGFFKPNIATLLGNLYSDPRYRANKDTGYNIFYMGINLGALVCNFVAAVMRNKIGWHGAFISAGVGMFIGVITFWLGIKNYKHVDVLKEPKPEDKPFITQFIKVLLTGLGFSIIGWFIPDNIFGSDSTDAFFMFCVPVIYFYASIYKKANAEERKPLGTMFTIFMIVVLFWAIFKQNATALTTYAELYTDREIPGSITPFTKQMGFSEEIVAKDVEVTQVDEQFRPIKNTEGKPVKVRDYPVYFKNVEPGNIPKEGGSVHLINTEIFQSINPLFVVLLTPLLIVFFGFLRKRNNEPTTATKIAFGLLISALSTLVMVAAVYYSDNGMNKASSWWLFASYGVITLGELLLSPMGLSMVSKLAPVRLTALMMGGWQLATSIGNKLSGVLAKNWDKFDDKMNYFWLNFVLLMFAFLIMMLLLKRLNRVFKEGFAH
jgi:POT family proton-dependent oligopeptide transporter